MDDDYGFVWLEEDLYAKGKFLVRGAITQILEPLEMYGQKEYVLSAVEEIWKIVEDWGFWVRGDLSKPISVDYIRRNKEVK